MIVTDKEIFDKYVQHCYLVFGSEKEYPTEYYYTATGRLHALWDYSKSTGQVFYR